MNGKEKHFCSNCGIEVIVSDKEWKYKEEYEGSMCDSCNADRCMDAMSDWEFENS